MRIYKAGETLPEGAAITIGNFDGIHRAHQFIVAELKDTARKLSLRTGLVTFEPSPQFVIHQEFQYILTPLEEKKERLAALELDFLYVIPFNQRLRATPAEAFLKELILDILKPRWIVVGYDHRFGNDRQGDTELITALSRQYQFELLVCPEFMLAGAAVKSTRIRERLVLGAVHQAAELLGYRYSLAGRIVRGRGLGTQIGFPTLNIEPLATEKLIPAPGVYAVYARFEGQDRPAVMNIGFRPTFSGTTQTLEIHILDFDDQVHEQILAVSFVDRLRPERKFDSAITLKRQIALDVKKAREVLAKDASVPPTPGAQLHSLSATG
jgi:riboflavin kinase/FMN adenylyltransferase